MATSDASQQEKWKYCLEIFECNVKPEEFQTWFKPIEFVTFQKHKEGGEKMQVVLRVPSNYFIEILDGQYKRLMFNAVWRAFGKGTTLLYIAKVDSINNIETTVEPPKPPTNKDRLTKDKVFRQPAQETSDNEFDSRLNTEYSFDNFIEGECNKLPRSVGLSIAENPKQKTFNPLFIYGTSGVGKTHLVNAIGTRFKELHPRQRVLYVDAQQFTVQFTDSARQNTRNDFINFYQTIDVLIIDDIQALAGQEKTQLAFFHIFNHLRMNGKQIILTSDKAPSELQGLEDRLLTRFKWGLAAELEKPNRDLCHKILVNKISQDHLQIPEDVVDYIAQNVNNSIRDLEGILNSLMAHSVVYSREIDLAMAEQVVNRAVKFHTREATLEEITSVTCAQWNITQENLFSKSRKANIVAARQIAMYMASQLTKLTSTRIGLLIGGRNHATVLHAIKQVRDRMATDQQFCNIVKEIEHTLKSMQ